MAVSGMEQIAIGFLTKMGIDPEGIKALAQNVARIAQDSDARLTRIESKLDTLLELIEPKPDGGYVLGTGDKDDIVSVESEPPEFHDDIKYI
jgi:hypothetical protein